MNLLCKSVDWFLYTGNTGLNGKMDVWLMNAVKINMLTFKTFFMKGANIQRKGSV